MTPYAQGLVFLAIAIAAEVIATTSLKACAQFTRFVPSIYVVVGYCTAFYFHTLVLRTIPVGIAYAIWSGLGIVLVTLAASVVYRQMPDPAAILGITLIVAGVAVINLFSQTTTC